MFPRVVLKHFLFPLILSTLAVSNSVHADEKPKSGHAKKRVVGILVYPEVEALDFCGPYEVFSLAHTHDAPPASGKSEAMGPMNFLFDVRIVAASTQPVTVRGGMKVVPTESFDSCPQVDILVIPGGGKAGVVNDAALLAWVSKQAKKAELVTSVCTGSFILAEAGLLDGKSSATHQMAVKKMRAKYPKVTVIAGKRVVEDGNIVTAAGVSSGLDMSLQVVGKLHGDDVAGMVAEIIEYHPSTAAKK